MLRQKQVRPDYTTNARDFVRTERVRARRRQRHLDRIRAEMAPVYMAGIYATIRALLATPTPDKD